MLQLLLINQESRAMKLFYILLISLVACGSDLSAGNLSLLKSKENPFKKNGTSHSILSDGNGPHFAIKLNLTQLILPGISMQAEYAFHKKMSIGLGASILPQREFPTNLYNLNDNPYASNFSSPVFEGKSITPEFRFYPFGREGHSAPNGFYIAAYLRYSHYIAHQTVSYHDMSSSGAPTYSANATHDYAGTTGGLMIGKQWIIAKYLTIDWWIIGGGVGRAKYTYSWQVDGVSLTPDQQAFVKQQATENFKSVSIFGSTPSVETTSNSVLMSAMLPMYSVRFMGLCIGFAF